MAIAVENHWRWRLTDQKAMLFIWWRR